MPASSRRRSARRWRSACPRSPGEGGGPTGSGRTTGDPPALVVAHLSGGDQDGDDDAGLAPVHHVVGLVAQAPAAPGSIRVASGSVVLASRSARRWSAADAPHGGLPDLPPALGQPVVAPGVRRGQFRRGGRGQAWVLRDHRWRAGLPRLRRGPPAGVASSRKSCRRPRREARAERVQRRVGLHLGPVEVDFCPTSPAAWHRSTIASKKRRNTSRPYRARIRVRLEWSGTASPRSYPRYQRTLRRSATRRNGAPTAGLRRRGRLQPEEHHRVDARSATG